MGGTKLYVVQPGEKQVWKMGSKLVNCAKHYPVGTQVHPVRNFFFEAAEKKFCYTKIMDNTKCELSRRKKAEITNTRKIRETLLSLLPLKEIMREITEPLVFDPECKDWKLGTKWELDAY